MREPPGLGRRGLVRRYVAGVPGAFPLDLDPLQDGGCPTGFLPVTALDKASISL